MKVCTGCKLELSLENFYKQFPTKYRAKCKSCYDKRNNEYRRTDAGRKSRRKINKKYYATDSGKAVRRAFVNKYRTRKLNAMPTWADQERIKHIYWMCNLITKITGIEHHVDHIIPLQGEDVCGLHVPENLQILTAEENLRKGNKLIPIS